MQEPCLRCPCAPGFIFFIRCDFSAFSWPSPFVVTLLSLCPSPVLLCTVQAGTRQAFTGASHVEWETRSSIHWCGEKTETPSECGQVE